MILYHVAPGVRWAVERTTLTLVDGRGGACRLGYPEAAVWDLVSRGYPLAEVARMIAAIASLDPTAADAIIRSAIEGWERAGLIRRA